VDTKINFEYSSKIASYCANLEFSYCFSISTQLSKSHSQLLCIISSLVLMVQQCATCFGFQALDTNNSSRILNCVLYEFITFNKGTFKNVFPYIVMLIMLRYCSEIAICKFLLMYLLQVCWWCHRWTSFLCWLRHFIWCIHPDVRANTRWEIKFVTSPPVTVPSRYTHNQLIPFHIKTKTVRTKDDFGIWCALWTEQLPNNKN
jgi:hypothetical protein